MLTSPGSVVVGVNGTPECVPALRWAATDAHTRHRPLHLVHAYRWPIYVDTSMASAVPWFDPAAMRPMTERIVADALDTVRGWYPELEVSGEVVEGPGSAAQMLLEHSAGAAEIVIGSRHLGAIGGTVLGSVGLTVAARADCPVVVLRGPEGHPDERAPVVVGVDGTTASTTHLGYAFDHASRHHVPLRAVLCWRPLVTDPSHWTSAAEAEATHQHGLALAEVLAGWQEKYPDVSVERRVVTGRPTDTLVAQARAAHLLVVGARGHHALAGALLGSVSQGVLHHATCPVAVVHA